MSRAEETQSTESIEQTQERKRSPAEWVTFGIASFILAFVIGLVMYVWLDKQHQQPPKLYVSTESTRQEGEQFYVPFKVTNTGGKTAESVQVIAELRINGTVEEMGEQQIDFLSENETEEGSFVFSRNPTEGELIVRVASYKLP